MRRVHVSCGQDLAWQVGASVALRTASSGPVGLLLMPGGLPPEGDDASSETEQLIPRGFPIPLPTPGAARLAARLRRSGHRATARWRLVICIPRDQADVDDAAAIVEAETGTVTGLTVGSASDCEFRLIGCDMAVAVVPVDAPSELITEAGATLSELAGEVRVLRLGSVGLGDGLPLAGICPPPAWEAELEALDLTVQGVIE